eukprot:scaffold125524_cov30-Phaeocystis_antarctica.AAC.1
MSRKPTGCRAWRSSCPPRGSPVQGKARSPMWRTGAKRSGSSGKQPGLEESLAFFTWLGVG